ncbi:hypothetical protein ABZX65_07255 [Streptomyces sp. NPDC003300]|uniref:hypothetical protein n=1 Tax=unclassified Streptomyces TaxID=2593676 RepID=UPI0033A60070
MTTATGDPAASLTELTDRWADAERTGDADALAALVTDDLTMVGRSDSSSTAGSGSIATAAATS